MAGTNIQHEAVINGDWPIIVVAKAGPFRTISDLKPLFFDIY